MLIREPAGQPAGTHDADQAAHLEVGCLKGREAKDAAHKTRHQQDEHHNAAREHPGDEHGDPDAEARGLDNFFERELGKRLAFAHLLEDRRFLKEAAQINRDQTEDAADHERNAPGPVGKFRRRVDEVHQERNEGTEQNAAGDATREKADKGVLVAGRCVFMNEDPSARQFAADRDALANSNENQKERSSITDRFVRRNYREREGRDDHQRNREHEHVLSAELVAEVSHHDAAERAGEITGGKSAVSVQHGPELTDPCGEEVLGNNLREEEHDDEVVKLQDPAER